MRSLCVPMKAEGYTSLKIRYNWKKDDFKMEMMKQWEQDIDFSKYNKEFYVESILTDDVVYLNTKQVRELYKKYDLEDYLEEILDLIRQGRHFGIECYYNDKYNIRFMCHQHSRKLGLKNKLHATLAGGIRRHDVEEDEKEVIIDGLNLGRGMSFKNVAGNLAFGGCKTTVQMDELDLENLEIMGFLGFCIDNCRTMTGPDMNFPTEMADVENEHFSMQYTSGPNSPLGETGKPTAYGVYVTMKQAVKFKEGTESLAGKSISLIGLGAVGWYLGQYVLQEDVKLYIADINPATCKKFKEQYPGRDIEIVSVDDAMYLDVDIVSPCAIGGIFHDENIPQLKCSIIWGSANNQLKASSQEEEIRISKLLAERDILFQTEWWHNTAGVICGAEEYLKGADASYDELTEKIDATMPKQTWDNLNKAKALGITPCECVYMTCQDIIYGE